MHRIPQRKAGGNRRTQHATGAVNVADVWPAATVTDPGTVATAVLLLVSVTVAPVVADKVTVP